MPDFLYGRKFWKLDHNFRYFSQFSAVQAQKRPEFYFWSNFVPQIWNSHVLFLFEYKFWWRVHQDL